MFVLTAGTLLVALVVSLILLYFPSTGLYLEAWVTAPSTETNVDVVIAQYGEDLAWVDDFFPPEWNVIVYSKKPDVPVTMRREHTRRFIPNVGREHHTYAHHILEHHGKTGSVFTIFCPGSAYAIRYKRRRMQNIVHLAASRDLIFPALIQIPHIVGGEKCFSSVDRRYCSTHAVNRHGDCAIIPSGYSNVWEFARAVGLDPKRIWHMSRTGVGGVSARVLDAVDRDVLMKLQAHLEKGDNVESGHFAERLWYSIMRTGVDRPWERERR